MANHKSNILIINHGFPPNPGIAGRRWAKFSKYLLRENYNVYVLASKNIHDKESEWISDIKGIPVEYLPFNFPKIIHVPKNDFFNKVNYKLSQIVLKVVNKGNFYDRSYFWKKNIQSKIASYIKEKSISTVVVTAGPFILSYYVTSLKQQFPNVKFIVDFRDLWTTDTEITSFATLSEKRVLNEKVFEKRTVLNADTIITVNDAISDYFKNLAINTKIITIPNGYDDEDFFGINENITQKTESNDILRFVFAGTLYINLIYILTPFFKGLAELKKTNPELYKRLQFEFYGSFPKAYLDLIDEYDLKSIFYIQEKIPLKEVYQKIRNSTACMLFLNDVYNFALSTKFCEYISQNKKIIVVANEGPTSKFVTNNKLGYWISPNNVESDLNHMLSQIINPKIEKTISNFDITQFSIKKLTKKLITIIDENTYNQTSNYNKKNLLLTFDYELYLGKKSGTVLNSIIEPTDLILKTINKNDLKHVLFFVDTTYIKVLEDKAKTNNLAKSDLLLIKKQLTTILENGHYIFPHIHPHWIDAKYNDLKNEWSLNDFSKYRFHNISDELKYELFNYSITFIQSIQLDAKVNYNIDSYRAGGWCIQPFIDFKSIFNLYGIKNDFSVLKGQSIKNNLFYFDFTKSPTRPIYNFSSDIIAEDNLGEFKEFSISDIKMNQSVKLISKLIKKLNRFNNYAIIGDGTYVDKTEYGSTSEIIEKKSSEPASIDFLDSFKVKSYIDFLKENNYLQLISHPKLASENSLGNFDLFLKKLKDKYEIETDYKKMY